MQVLLVFGAELGPDDLLKTVWLCVDESGVLRNWQVRISGREKVQNDSILLCLLLINSKLLV